MNKSGKPKNHRVRRGRIKFRTERNRRSSSGGAVMGRRTELPGRERFYLSDIGQQRAATLPDLPSIIEEQEAAKEQLRSANRELQASIVQLQRHNAELNQANNDLTNLLASVNLAVLMLSEDLTIRRFTPMAERI